MKALFSRPDLRLLLAGQTLSMFGDWAMIIALGIWAKVLTGSNSAAGLVFFVFALAGLVAPLGGLVVDRLRKRPLMIATHLALAGVICLLVFVHDRGDMWLLYLVTALYGLGGNIFSAARSAMLKAMLPRRENQPARMMPPGRRRSYRCSARTGRAIRRACSQIKPYGILICLWRRPTLCAP